MNDSDQTPEKIPKMDVRPLTRARGQPLYAGRYERELDSLNMYVAREDDSCVLPDLAIEVRGELFG